MKQLQQLQNWFLSLPLKEQRLVSATAAFIMITLFYIVVWEPMHMGLDAEQQKQQSQKEILLWMQKAAAEVKSLQASGSKTIRDTNKPTTLVIEQAINNAGLKESVTKIESSGNNGARVTLNDAAFNQLLIWLNTLATNNGILVVSANIERSDIPGRTNARLTFERP